ncbi:unnamed protein product [Closterium sp. Naga37s-1]|nr:unnamed protein product [Closterium sp. Naga37s-1]
MLRIMKKLLFTASIHPSTTSAFQFQSLDHDCPSCLLPPMPPLPLATLPLPAFPSPPFPPRLPFSAFPSPTHPHHAPDTSTITDNRLSGTIPACIGNLTALTSLCAHSPSNPPSPSIPLSACLSVPSIGGTHFSSSLLHFSSSLLHFSSSLLHFSSPHLLLSSSPLFSDYTLPPFSASSLLLVTSSPRLPSFPPCPFIHPSVFRALNANRLAGTIPAAITTLTNLEYLRLDHNQLTGELPSFHHMVRLTSQRGLFADHNYLTATADPLPFNATGLEDPAESHSLCLFHHNCLGHSSINCGRWHLQKQQKRTSECRAFCGAQPLTPPCSGHGVCSFEPDPSEEMSAFEDEDVPPPPYCEPEGQCDCDEGYTPGPAAGTCVPHGMPVAECPR